MTEMRRLMQVLETGAALDGKTVIHACERIARKMRILACKQLDNIDTKLIGAFIKKRERKILVPGFLSDVFLNGATSRLRHVFAGKTRIFA